MVLALELGGNGGSNVARVAARGIVPRMGMGRDWASHITRVAARRVGGDIGVRRDEVGLFVVGRPLKPTDVLHVGHPNIVSGLSSPDAKGNQGDGIPEKHCPKDETERGDPLSGSAVAITKAINSNTKDGSRLGTSSEPHDPEERQPPHLKDKL